MRLRNNPKANDILAAHDDIVILDGKQYRGKWNELFGNSNPIYIEIGMGKGDFIIENALRYPNINYIGIEKFPSVMVGAIKKIDQLEAIPSNLKLLKEIFDEENEIGSLYYYLKIQKQVFEKSIGLSAQIKGMRY